MERIVEEKEVFHGKYRSSKGALGIVGAWARRLGIDIGVAVVAAWVGATGEGDPAVG